jgi:rhodanese-related sulfurtransferase
MPNSAPQAPGLITVTDAYDRARAGEAVLLDVREADEYSVGHAPGSTWQPLITIAAGADRGTGRTSGRVNYTGYQPRARHSSR